MKKFIPTFVVFIFLFQFILLTNSVKAAPILNLPEKCTVGDQITDVVDMHLRREAINKLKTESGCVYQKPEFIDNSNYRQFIDGQKQEASCFSKLAANKTNPLYCFSLENWRREEISACLSNLVKSTDDINVCNGELLTCAEKAQCLAKFGEKYNRVDLCLYHNVNNQNNYSAYPVMNCVANLAITNNNPTLCEQLNDTNLRYNKDNAKLKEACIEQVASATGNAEICDTPDCLQGVKNYNINKFGVSDPELFNFLNYLIYFTLVIIFGLAIILVALKLTGKIKIEFVKLFAIILTLSSIPIAFWRQTYNTEAKGPILDFNILLPNLVVIIYGVLCCWVVISLIRYAYKQWQQQSGDYKTILKWSYWFTFIYSYTICFLLAFHFEKFISPQLSSVEFILGKFISPFLFFPLNFIIRLSFVTPQPVIHWNLLLLPIGLAYVMITWFAERSTIGGKQHFINPKFRWIFYLLIILGSTTIPWIWRSLFFTAY